MVNKDVQQLSVLFYVFSYLIIITNSRTSYLWRLNEDKSKIVEVKLLENDILQTGGPSLNVYPYDDPLFQILMSTEHEGSSWVKKAPDSYFCTDCQKVQQPRERNSSNIAIKHVSDIEKLDCGKPVNFTYYDNLGGVLNRKKHPAIPDSHLVFLYNQKVFKNGQKDIDLDALEKKLRRARKERPKSVQLYNQIGQYWYFKGNAEIAIECFRRALAISPHNSEILLNLARILYSLQYLDDAIYLTRRSLEMENSDKIAWQQYFMLGQIFKAYGHYQEAAVHLRHTLELKPGFEPALLALLEIEYLPPTSIHLYTMVIIIFLASIVVLIMAISVDNKDKEPEGKTTSRSKSLSMRSLRITLSHKRKKGTT